MTRDWLTEGRALRDHPESITTAKDATAIAVGLYEMWENLQAVPSEQRAYEIGFLAGQKHAQHEIEQEREVQRFGGAT